MKISTSLEKSLPIQIALLTSAHSAMTTTVLTQGQALDLSRLTLLGFSLQICARPPQILSANCSLIQIGEVDAGHRFNVKIDFWAEDVIAAAVEFEILNRKRGLSTRALRAIQAPKVRINSDSRDFEVKLDQISCSKPNLINYLEFWPIDALFEAALGQTSDTQSPENIVEFRLFGAAQAELPCQIKTTKSVDKHGVITEVKQNNCLIAQLIENSVL